MGSITITNRDGSNRVIHDGKIDITNSGESNSIPLKIHEVSGIEPLKIEEVQNIAPIAHHLKEVNNIDPINVDTFHVNEIRNIDPIKVEKFQVTNLPPVNVSLRELPAVNMNVSRMPPLSVGTHQNFHVPSNYTISGKVFGFEVFRVHINGDTHMISKEKHRREHEISHNRSFPKVAVAGNPAIPSESREVESSTCDSHNYGKTHRRSALTLREG